MTNRAPTDQHRQNALERILEAAAAPSARLVNYAAAAVTIAYIVGWDPASLALISPALAQLVEKIGGDVLANLLDRVADDDSLSPEQIRALLQEALAGTKLEEVLTERDFRLTISRLQRQDKEKYRTLVRRLDQILDLLPEARPATPGAALPRPGATPPLPALIVGREEALRDLKSRLGIRADSAVPSSLQVLTAVRGWPGVGKTTVAAALAYDPDIATAFPDGVLWVSLGPTPSLLSELAAWGRALGSEDLLSAETVEQASAQLAALLRDKRMLLIVDDVWEPEHAIRFTVGGRGCAVLVTTRANSVAQALAPTPADIYRLDVLGDEEALELLQVLAPTVIAQYPEQSLELVHELEGLPLALQVAGRLLNVEAGYGFDVMTLITELREGASLIEAAAPADRVDLANETIPTVAVLLQKSTDRLDPEDRDRFAFLSPFAPKPATFDLAAMKAVWQVDDPKPTVRILVDRGLLEPVPETGRFQVPALLLMHAKSLLTEQ